MLSVVLISWNIRGASSGNARRMIKDLAVANKANFVCLQETKCGAWSNGMINSIWDYSHHGWVAKEASGLSGGLLCSWDNKVFDLIQANSSDNWIWCHMRNLADGATFHIINVYGPHDQQKKIAVWSCLKAIMQSLPNEAVCLIGDFNCIRHDGERECCSFRRRDMEIFNDFISTLNLLELDLTNARFT